MQKSRVKRVGALLVGLTLVAAACGSDDDASSSTDAPAGTEAAAEATTAPEHDRGVTGDDRGPGQRPIRGEGETVQAAPTCTGESDGILNIATVLPETGNLAFLGPPEFAGIDLAIARDQRSRRRAGRGRHLDQGDSGDTSTDIANQTVDRQLAAGADAFIGAASSGVSFTFIDKLVENCKIHFSPANTSPDFTDYAEDDLYFRTAPSDVLQGRVLADLMIEEGVTTASFMALQDPYGEGLLKYSTEPYADRRRRDRRAVHLRPAGCRVLGRGRQGRVRRSRGARDHRFRGDLRRSSRHCSRPASRLSRARRSSWSTATSATRLGQADASRLDGRHPGHPACR